MGIRSWTVPKGWKGTEAEVEAEVEAQWKAARQRKRAERAAALARRTKPVPKP